MPTITIPDDTYAALSRKAAAVGVSTDEYIALTLVTAGPPPVAPATKVLRGDEWRKAFDEWMREVQSRAADYPTGFELDVSRDAMYPDPNGDGR